MNDKHLSKLNNNFLYRGKWVDREELSKLQQIGKQVRNTIFYGLAINIEDEVVAIIKQKNYNMRITKVYLKDNQKYIKLVGGHPLALERFLE